MANLYPIQKIRALVTDKGLLTEENRVYFDTLENLVPKYGSGTPEGVVEADEGATYYDLDAAIGSRHYIKIYNSVSGDRSLGWELA